MVRLLRWADQDDVADRVAAAIGAPTTFPDVVTGLVLGGTVRATLNAVAAERAPDEPVQTGYLLATLVRHDPLGDWERVWEQTGDPDRSGLRTVLDGDPTPITPGPPGLLFRTLTADVALSLRVLHRLVHHYRMNPVPPGALAIALVSSPGAGATRALLGRGALSHEELLRRMAVELLHVDLPDRYPTVTAVA